jgi:hypothetical protein
MKESYRKGLANHPGPESCVADRKAEHEALTGEQAGWVLSREIDLFQGADVVRQGGRQHRWTSILRDPITLRGRRPQTCLETLCARTGRPQQRPPCEKRRAGRRTR